MSLRIQYYDVPQGAQAAMTVSGQGQPFSVAQSIASGSRDVAYATLESGGWPLDGSRVLLPGEPEDMWWSSCVSNENGVFSQPPVLEVGFTQPYTATGLSFAFSPSTQQWCTRMQVRWYNGQTLLAQVMAQPDSARYVLQQTVEGFDKIRLELLETNLPGQFAKLQQLQIGQLLLFDRESLTQVTLVNEIDPNLLVLTVDTMQVQIRGCAGYDLRPQQNQQMELYQDETLLASHYITESERTAKDQYRFTCQSAIGLLSDEFLGGIYEDAAAEDVLGDILDGREYILDGAFADARVSGYLPVCTRREALQQLSFAIGAVVTTRGCRCICLMPPAKDIGGRFAPGEIFSGSRMEVAPSLARVEVVSHNYRAGQQETVLVENEPMYGRDLLLTFQQPYHSYTISGGTITRSGANYIRIDADGPVHVTAKEYIHSTVTHSKDNPKATAQERSNALRVEEATLVGSQNVSQVLQRLYASAQLRQTVELEAVVKEQRAGQKVTVVNPWGSHTSGYITAMDATLTQTGHTAAVTVCGTEKPATAVYGYAGELYAGGQEVVYE